MVGENKCICEQMFTMLVYRRVSALHSIIYIFDFLLIGKQNFSRKE